LEKGFDIVPVSVDDTALARYSRLLSDTFPEARHFTVAYLRWLYCANPDGPVFGFDAWRDGDLAAHYVCIPTTVALDGTSCRMVLSLNTATAPRYRGRGLMIVLAERTYESAALNGAHAVYGVANANSTPGFIRRLGFDLVGPLDAKIGIGSLDGEPPTEVAERASFSRTWNPESLAWRLLNPEAPWTPIQQAHGGLTAVTRTHRPLVRAWATVACNDAIDELPGHPAHGLNLHLGLRPDGSLRSRKPWVDVPEKFRASPLNLIFRPLIEGTAVPDLRATMFGALDFDAF
jgi:hypothetical protein